MIKFIWVLVAILSVTSLIFGLEDAIQPREGEVLPTQVLGCSMCQYLAQELYDWLAQNTTEELIRKYMQQRCQSLPPPVNDQCSWVAEELTKLIPIIIYHIPRQDILPIDVCGLIRECEIQCCQSAAPEQVRLSGISDATVMIVSWVTPNKVPAIVEYGLYPSSLTMRATGDTHTYDSGNWKGWIHNVTLSGLSTMTRYFYRVGSQEGGWSKVFHFKTWMNTGYEKTNSTWLVIGDMGTNHESDDTIARITQIVRNDEVIGILHNGDLAYADGVQRRWDLYGRKVEPFAAYTQYQVCPGNHELAIVTYLGLEGYRNRWYMPYDFPLDRGGSQEAFWYTFTRGPLRVIALNSESRLDIAEIASYQIDWLKETLVHANATRKAHPWIVVMFHRPLYCNNVEYHDCQVFTAWLRNWLEDIFYQFRVDVVLTAHMHSAERTFPIYRSQMFPGFHNAKAPVHIINGAAGNREGISEFVPQPENWSAFRTSANGYGMMTVSMNSLTWKFYSSKDNVLRDTMVLTKD